MALQYNRGGGRGDSGGMDPQMAMLASIIMQGMFADERLEKSGDIQMAVAKMQEESADNRLKMTQAFDKALNDQKAFLERQRAIEADVLQALNVDETAIMSPVVQAMLQRVVATDQAATQAFQAAVALAGKRASIKDATQMIEGYAKSAADEAIKYASGKEINEMQGAGLADAILGVPGEEYSGSQEASISGAVGAVMHSNKRIGGLVAQFLNNELASDQAYTEQAFPGISGDEIGGYAPVVTESSLAAGGMESKPGERQWGGGRKWRWPLIEDATTTPLSASAMMDAARTAKVGSIGLVQVRRTLEALQKRLLPDNIEEMTGKSPEEFMTPKAQALYRAAGNVIQRISATPEGTMDLKLEALNKTYREIIDNPGPDGGLNWEPLRQHAASLMQDEGWWSAFETAAREVDPGGNLPIGQLRQAIITGDMNAMTPKTSAARAAEQFPDAFSPESMSTIEALRKTADVASTEAPDTIAKITESWAKQRAAASVNMALYRLRTMPVEGAPAGFTDTTRKELDRIAQMAGIRWDPELKMYQSDGSMSSLAQQLGQYYEHVSTAAKKAPAAARPTPQAPATPQQAEQKPQAQAIEIKVPTPQMPQSTGASMPQGPDAARNAMAGAAAPQQQAPVAPMPTQGYVPGQGGGQ